MHHNSAENSPRFEPQHQFASLARIDKLPDLRRQSLTAVHAVMAMRLCVLCCHAAEDPTTALAERFGSALSANRFRMLMATIDAGWPDNFLVSRPCCMKMTSDEALVAALVDHVALMQRASFDELCAEMLNEELREQIWIRLLSWLRSLPKTHLL